MSTRSPSYSTYLPLNAEALQWGIYCNDVGYTRVPPGTPYPPHPEAHPREFSERVTTGRTLSEFQLVHIPEGYGHFWSVQTGRVRVDPGTVFVVFPGVVHAYSPDAGTGWVEQWIGFAGWHVERLRAQGLISESRPIHRVGADDELRALFDVALELCRIQTPGFQVRLGALILQMIANTHARSLHAEQPEGARETVERARRLMYEAQWDGVDVTTIARLCGVSYSQLRRAFRRYTGLAPYQYFLQLRIHLAKQLLRGEPLLIKDVAERLNFENQYYFARVFRERTGMSPSEWRDSQRAGSVRNDNRSRELR